MKPGILVTREVFDETIDFLKSHFEVESNQADRLYAREELIAKLQGKDGVQTSSSDRIDAELLDKCPTIKAVCNTAVGYNNIDIDACTRHLDKEFRQRGVQVVQQGSHTLLLAGGKLFKFIPNPTFDPIIVAGCMDLMFRGQIPEGVDPSNFYAGWSGGEIRLTRPVPGCLPDQSSDLPGRHSGPFTIPSIRRRRA